VFSIYFILFIGNSINLVVAIIEQSNLVVVIISTIFNFIVLVLILFRMSEASVEAKNLTPPLLRVKDRHQIDLTGLQV
jgi:hypothetical protein